MYCKNCGKEIIEGEKFCKNCGEKILNNLILDEKERIKNYIELSIVSILFCVPFGVAGLIFSTEVEKNLKKGDIKGAKESSKKAKKYSLIGIIIGIPLTIIYISLLIMAEFSKCS